jgi:asparagine synthase (glutamine-hydrolysing)
MLATLRHRGPDDAGLHTDPSTDATIGVRRLAIVDLKGGHQPLSNEDGSVWVAFNGEIYNHVQLRDDLRARGHRFTTSSDTEVLVHLYEEFGDSMVHALEGMFAFALWDERHARLLLVRDRFGEKPMFVHESAGELLFASELTALLEAKSGLRELDPDAIDAFFVFGYVPGPGTVVPGVRQLPPGHLLVWERDGGCQERCWWSPPEGSVRLREPAQALVAEAKHLFEESVRTRMIADVPVGVFLSGGIDSTLVTAIAAQQSSRRLKTFTIGYDVGSFDETAQARQIARDLDTEHHEITLTQADVATRVPALLSRLDQPLADQALVPLHALSEFARPLVTVALGGEGADELFGGYPRYRWLERAGRIESALPAPLVGLLGSLPRYSGRYDVASRLIDRITPTAMIERHMDWVTGGRRRHRAALYGPRLADINQDHALAGLVRRAGGELDVGSIGRHLMHLDQVDYLPDDVLVKTDRAGMLMSLEIRTVYLHRGLAELAASVDTSLHLGGGGKTLLHAMLPADVSPPRASGRYRKTAFRAPAAEWLRGSLVPVLRSQLESGVLYREGYFDRVAAGELVREHVSSICDHSDLLWPLLALGLWADRFFGLDVG